MKSSKLQKSNSAPHEYWKHGTTQTSAQNASNQWKVVTSATKTTHLFTTTSTTCGKLLVDPCSSDPSRKHIRTNPAPTTTLPPSRWAKIFLPLQKGNTPLQKTRITSRQALDAVATRANRQINRDQRPKLRTHLGQMIRIPIRLAQKKKTEHMNRAATTHSCDASGAPGTSHRAPTKTQLWKDVSVQPTTYLQA